MSSQPRRSSSGARAAGPPDSGLPESGLPKSGLARSVPPKSAPSGTNEEVARPGDPQTRSHILDAALALLLEARGAPVSMSEVARRAGVSRQALYLHFDGRADLLTSVARHADDRRGLPEAIRGIEEAGSGPDAVRAMVDLQARMNPGIWPVALALEEARRGDEAAERAWQDRLDARLGGCRAIAARLAREGTLRAGLTEEVAADLLWTLTSLRTWEDLVLQRGWSAGRYRKAVTRTALLAVTNPRGSRGK